MSLKQKLHFGTKRQRNAAKASLSRKRHNPKRKSAHRRLSNVGEIISLSLPNPSKRRKNISMAKVARKRNPGRKRRRNAPKAWSKLYAAHYRKSGRKRNPARRRARRSNPRVIVRYKTRRNPARRHHSRMHRRRNPGINKDLLMKVVGNIGGFALTSFLTNMLPANLTTGTVGIGSTAIVALGQGWAVSKVNKQLGEDMLVGGITYAVMKLINTFAPGILPASLSGLGVIGNSSFTVPQVPLPGSMGRFQIAPDYQRAIAAAAAANASSGVSGLYPAANGGSRTSLRRVGRMS